MKYISLNHRSDALQWYESIHTHVDTWGLFFLPSTTIFKGVPIGGVWKIQFLSSGMMSKRIYMKKLIAKLINAKTMLGLDCSYFK